MTTPFPARATIAGTPDNASAQNWLTTLWDSITGLLGVGGNLPDARSQLGVDRPTISPSVASNALTVALKTANGLDPTAAVPLPIPFRSATLSSGAIFARLASAVTSLVVPSGATLGTVSGKDAWLYVYALDTGGAVELAICGANLGSNTTGNTVAISATAIDGTTLYSSNARTGVPLRIIGAMRSNQTVAGTWAAVPVQIQYPESSRLTLYTPDNSFTTGGTSTAYTIAPALLAPNTEGNEFTVTFHTAPGANPSLAAGTGAAMFLAYRAHTGVLQVPGPAQVPANWTSRVRLVGTLWIIMDPAGEYTRADILAAVSHSAGVPTGGIIERASNANGEYVRFADGTQICSGATTITTTAANALAINTISYPSAFLLTPRVVTTPSEYQTNQGISTGTYPPGLSTVTIAMTSSIAGLPMSVTYVAIGRWF